MPSPGERRDRGRDDRRVLVAERAALAGVRVEPGEREPRPRDAEAPAQVAVDDPRRLDDQLRRQARGDLRQRDVDRHRHDGERLAPQHHHRMRRRPAGLDRERRQELGVARVGKARLVEDVLRDRVGDEARGLSGAREPNRLLDRREGRGGRRRVGLAGLRRNRLADRRDRQRAAEDVRGVGDRCALDGHAKPQALGCPAHEIGVAEEAEGQADLVAPKPGLERDLRPDAGRVALREGEDRRARAATASA